MRLCSAILLLWVAAQPGHEARGQELGSRARAQTAYLRGVATHFRISFSEVEVLSAWDVPVDEVPVVLYLSTRGGVSPDVVVSLRRDGLAWLELARRLGIGVGDFYVMLQGPPGSLSGAYARFEGRPRREWDGVVLSDQEVVALVNVQVLARILSAPPHRVLRSFEEAGDFVTAYARLGASGTG